MLGVLAHHVMCVSMEVWHIDSIDLDHGAIHGVALHVGWNEVTLRAHLVGLHQVNDWLLYSTMRSAEPGEDSVPSAESAAICVPCKLHVEWW